MPYGSRSDESIHLRERRQDGAAAFVKILSLLVLLNITGLKRVSGTVLELPRETGDFPHCGCGPSCNTRRRRLGAFGASVSSSHYFFLSLTTALEHLENDSCVPQPAVPHQNGEINVSK